MADYYPLLARALDALPDKSPGLRRAVYDRARNALISQLRSLEPPLSEDDIDLERRALDTAIERLEVEHGGIPAPANDAAKEKAAAAAPPPEAAPAPVSEPDPAPSYPEPETPAPSPGEPVPEPALPPASSPRFVITPEPATEKPREATIAIAARKAAGTSDAEFIPPVPPVVEPVESGPGETDVSSETAQGRQRPRIAVVAPRSGRSRILRNIVIGTVLIAVIGAIAVSAFLLRDAPQLVARSGLETAQPQTDNPEAKFSDRVGGENVPVEKPKAKQEGAAPQSPAPSTGESSKVLVAQRAFLIEEATAPDNAQPVTTTGRVTWRLDTANGEQGQPLQTTAVAVVTYPEAGLTLTMTIQKNLDATLPASHTVSLSFSQSGSETASRLVQDVGLLQAKDDENGRGSPVSGLPVRVRDNLFLIGLSSLPSDVERNMDLLLHRAWFDIALRYTTGRRAVLTFEKGQSGDKVLQQAFDAWK